VPRVLIDAAAIDAAVRRVAGEIDAAYHGRTPLLVGVLTGSFVFLADLVRALKTPVEVDFVAVASYGDAQRTSGVVRLLKDLERPIAGRHVLLVEDIVDTGLTLSYLLENFATREPASLAACVLLDKPAARAVSLQPEFVALECPPEFVVGYGLDHAGRFRQLPYLGALTPPAARSRSRSRR
jgi:hypoxanthine phosphoribosyltransferase